MTDWSALPSELIERPQWTCYRTEPKPDGKVDKIPVNPHTGKPGSHSNPEMWSTFDHALERRSDDGLAGVGFVFSKRTDDRPDKPDDPYTGVDLDGCRDKDTGEIKPWAQAIIKALDSYTEISRSEKGVHIFTKGSLDPGSVHRQLGVPVEVYDNTRFFTVTGKHLPGTPCTIEERAKQVRALQSQVFKPKPPKTPDPARTPGPILTQSDEEIMARARGARNADKFNRLWHGDTSEHGDDDSAADLALCNILAYRTRDPQQIDRLFRQSSLYRQKWDDKHFGNGQTYGEHTIDIALRDTFSNTAPSSSTGQDSGKDSAALGDTRGGRIAFSFRSPVEIADAAPESADWTVDGYLAKSNMTMIHAREKLGKSTLVFAMLGSVINGTPFLGQNTKQTKVVYLSEESDLSVMEKLTRFGLAEEKDRLRFLTRNGLQGRPGLATVAPAAIEECQRIGADLLVVDTLSFWTSLKPEAENDSGALQEALWPLMEATAAGLAVLVIHHQTKGSGELRGSTALGASVDIILGLYREAEKKNRRRLEGVGRYQSTPESLLLELDGDTYTLLGAPSEVAAEEREMEVWDALPAGEKLTEKEITLVTRLPHQRVNDALSALIREGKVIRYGLGKKGNPYRYERVADE